MALFAGDSGTGKTMSAEVVAGALGLDLYTVDLATVVDKYVGETEKNLERIFTEAAGVNGVLLFDEADAVFGKRSEVKDAHDRYANVESAYLLQRMETFDGLAVLATNLRANLDEAFTRRLDLVVDFPLPDAEQRLALWDRCLGAALPRGGPRPRLLRPVLRTGGRRHPVGGGDGGVPGGRRGAGGVDDGPGGGGGAGVPEAGAALPGERVRGVGGGRAVALRGGGGSSGLAWRGRLAPPGPAGLPGRGGTGRGWSVGCGPSVAGRAVPRAPGGAVAGGWVRVVWGWSRSSPRPWGGCGGWLGVGRLGLGAWSFVSLGAGRVLDWAGVGARWGCSGGWGIGGGGGMVVGRAVRWGSQGDAHAGTRSRPRT